MKPLSLVAAAALCALSTGCISNTLEGNSHWNLDSTGRRVAYQFTGYQGAEHETFREFQLREKQEFDKSLRRHFLNDNPDNPFQPHDGNYNELPPINSPWPDPFFYYFHWESLVTGAVLYGWTGAFIPIPINSVIGTFEEGGFAEFGEGFSGDDGASASRHTRRVPPAPEDFEVKHPEGPRRRVGG